MMDHRANDPAMLFRFKGTVLVLVGLVVALAIVGGLGVAALQQNLVSGTRFLGAALLLVIAMGALMLTSRSDVQVDGRGMARVLFGRRWTFIGWDNVRLITAFPVGAGNGTTITAINVYPIRAAGFGLTPSRKIFFTVGFDHAETFLDLLNDRIQTQGIPLKTADRPGGPLVPAARLDPRA